jgi:ACT domain-containing protein
MDYTARNIRTGKRANRPNKTTQIKRRVYSALQNKQATESHSNKDMEQNNEKQSKPGELTEKSGNVENTEKVTESDINDTKLKAEREEQERTRIKKGLFLEYFEKGMGEIKMACEKTGIVRNTFYKWRNEDPEFAKKLADIKIQALDDAEGMLMRLVRAGNPRAITYFLDRQHIKYKPHSVTEVVTGTRTLEDILDEAEAKLKEKKNARGIGTGTENPAGGVPENKGQEGGHGAVPTQQGPAVLLGKKDEEEHHTESPTKGNK